MTITATFYGDTEDEARAQFVAWQAREPKVELELLSLIREEARPWTWLAVVEMREREQMGMGL